MENNLFQISIVTPSFNSAKFIEDCIQSVLNQNYPNFEHIIIDGGSTDGTMDILKKYPHLKWFSEPDEGQSDALNKGFKMASGEIIGWLNSDDLYLAGTFAKVNRILKNDQLDGVYSNLFFCDEQLNITKKLTSHRPVKWLSLFHCYIPSATFFCKREIFDSGLLVDKTKHITMDKDFFARILYKGYKLHFENDYFSLFRWHSGNKSLDTKSIKEIRYREGLELYNQLSRFPFPNIPLGQTMYKLLSLLLLGFRKLLKTIP